MARTQLQRDPFARATLIRRSAPNRYHNSCAWCGTMPRTVYSYEWENDMGRAHGDGREYCSVSCWRAFNS